MNSNLYKVVGSKLWRLSILKIKYAKNASKSNIIGLRITPSDYEGKMMKTLVIKQKKNMTRRLFEAA